MPANLTIKQLHAATGSLVRKAARSRTPTVITDRGQPVAWLVAPGSFPAPKRRPRQILPDYAALMRQPPGASLGDDLDVLRGDR
jgi:antitoxin (DNA-binding transcriptional repressor) of toxin-antitoxin stability system